MLTTRSTARSDRRAARTATSTLTQLLNNEVLKCRGLHLVVTEVVPIGGVAGTHTQTKKKKKAVHLSRVSCSVFD